VSPRVGLEKTKQIDFGGIRTPDPSLLSKVAIPTTLPGPWDEFPCTASRFLAYVYVILLVVITVLLFKKYSRPYLLFVEVVFANIP
jgi:hypothetical protein